jgi:hypothetical protein
MEILHHTTLNFGGMLEYLHYTLVVWWSISIKLCWHVGVFPLTFFVYVGVFPLKVNGNTPPYHQSLMEILQHTTKV